MYEASTAQPLPESGTTVRNRAFAALGGLLAASALAVNSVLATIAVGDIWMGWLFAGLGCVLAYLPGFRPRVRLTEEGLDIRDVFLRHFVPWRDVVTLDAEGRGRFVVGLGDGRVISQVHYGTSLHGDLVRYRHHRRAVREVERWRARYSGAEATGGAGAGSRRSSPAGACLAVFLLGQIPVLVGLVVHHLGG
ncbi:hypothetical protein CQJ94_20665 [Glycomyces fuscus]|nr:hypothetical protein CQJ94_20665 [Glycomyces fuscus]